MRIWPKLEPSDSDVAEREADRMADRVLEGADAEFSEERKNTKQTEKTDRDTGLRKTAQSVSAGGVSIGPGNNFQAVAATEADGRPLDSAARAFMEPRFGFDFSQVRIHANVSAAEAARSVNAHAFTFRNHIVFDEGRYAPDTSAGRRLLAHELTHVIQEQRHAPATSNVSSPATTASAAVGELRPTVVQRQAATAASAPAGDATAAAAVASGDPDKVSDVPAEAWKSVTNADRRGAVLVMLSKRVMFPWNDTTVRNIINSYPEREQMDAADIDVIKRTVQRGSVSAPEVTGYRRIADDFDLAVEEHAGTNVKRNLELLEEIAKKYGLDREQEGGASGIPTPMDELQEAAAQVADAKFLLRQLRKIPVGHKPMEGSQGFLPSPDLQLFDPDVPPSEHLGATPEDEPAMQPWSKLKTANEVVELAIGKVMSANPALYLLAATPALRQQINPNDEHLQFTKTALADFESSSPEQAKKDLLNSYRKSKEKLEAVQGKVEKHELDVGSLDALGLKVRETPRFSGAFAKWVTQDHLEHETTKKEQIAAFMDFATAALLIGAVVGTAGGALAAAAILGAAATATTFGSAGVRLSNAADVNLTSSAGVKPEDRMTSSARANAAELQAAVAAVIAILSIGSAANLLKLAFRRSSTVVLDLANLSKLPHEQAAKAVTQSIREVGVAQTLAESGLKDADALLKYLPAESSEYAKVTEYIETINAGKASAKAAAPVVSGGDIGTQMAQEMKEAGFKGNPFREFQRRLNAMSPRPSPEASAEAISSATREFTGGTMGVAPAIRQGDILVVPSRAPIPNAPVMGIKSDGTVIMGRAAKIEIVTTTPEGKPMFPPQTRIVGDITWE
jgi:uncharacterized protein DUF4157